MRRIDEVLHMIEVVRSQRGGRKHETIITDTGSYSDIVFGLPHLIGYQYRPQLANLPDQGLWRFNTQADSGPLDQAARGRVDAEKIAAHWEDMCRIAVSLHSGELSGHDVTLSAFVRYIGIDGHYAFHLPDLGGTHRPLRDPTPATTNEPPLSVSAAVRREAANTATDLLIGQP